MKTLDLQISGVNIGSITKEGKVYLQRCPFCKLENYAISVSSGMCAWCGAEIKITLRPSPKRSKRVKASNNAGVTTKNGGGIKAVPLPGLPGDTNDRVRA
jgi:hypothetical protein